MRAGTNILQLLVSPLSPLCVNDLLSSPDLCRMPDLFNIHQSDDQGVYGLDGYG
jgi:hypothetical protein